MLTAAWAIALAVALQTAPAMPDSRPITRFLPNLWQDLRALPSQDTVWIAGIGAGAALAAWPADDRLSAWAERTGDARYTVAGDLLGRRALHFGAAFALYGAGKLWDKPQATHLGGDLIRAQTISYLLTAALKYSIDRRRPDAGHYALPSGHTSAAFTTAAVLHRHYGWRVGVPAYAAASLVAWTRVRDRRHWLSDVAAGAAIGIIAGRTVTIGHGAARYAVLPAPIPGGFAIVLQRVSR